MRELVVAPHLRRRSRFQLSPAVKFDGVTSAPTGLLQMPSLVCVERTMTAKLDSNRPVADIPGNAPGP